MEDNISAICACTMDVLIQRTRNLLSGTLANDSIHVMTIPQNGPFLLRAKNHILPGGRYFSIFNNDNGFRCAKASFGYFFEQ